LAKASWILRRNNLDVVLDEVKEQERFALRIRDDVSRLSGIVNDIRTIRKQLQLHEELLAKQTKAKAYLKRSQELLSKLNELEEKLHNPKAEVTYDILAQRGGAKLYSQYAALFEYLKDADGPPTQGMREVYTGHARELGRYVDELRGLLHHDVAKLNEMAKGLAIPNIIVSSTPETAKKR
jgi:hypothetical protein